MQEKQNDWVLESSVNEILTKNGYPNNKVKPNNILIAGVCTGKTSTLVELAHNYNKNNLSVLFVTGENTDVSINKKINEIGDINLDNQIIIKSTQPVIQMTLLDSYVNKYNPDVIILDQIEFFNTKTSIEYCIGDYLYISNFFNGILWSSKHKPRSKPDDYSLKDYSNFENDKIGIFQK